MISACGDDLDDCFQGLTNQRFNYDYRCCDYYQSYPVYTCSMGVNKSLAKYAQTKHGKNTDPVSRLIELNAQKLTKLKLLTAKEKQKTSVIIGTSRSTTQLLESTIIDNYLGNQDRRLLTSLITPRTSPYTTNSSLSIKLAIKYNLTGARMVVSSACSSALTAISIGYHQLTANLARYVLCGGAEWTNTGYVLNLLKKARVLAEVDKSDHRFFLHSFGKYRSGMVPASASGLCILSSQRTNNSLAKILAVTMKSENSGLVGISTQGTSIAQLINTVIEQSNIISSQIDLVAVHGSGTIKGDLAEINGINQVFCQRSKPYLMISKSVTGHSLGASAMLQLGFSLQSCINKYVPKPGYVLDDLVKNYKFGDLNFKDHYYVLLISLGFGGVMGAMMIKTLL